MRPALTEVVRLAQHTAKALAPVLGLSPYDALMDGFQPGVTAAAVQPVFAQYAAWLATALPAALEQQARQPEPLKLTGDFAPAKQEALCRHLAERAGLEPAHARLDQSTHPFCGGTPTDIRITTRYDPADPGQAIMGVLHETGHALYERGLPGSQSRQPVGEAAGMAVHESQSLIHRDASLPQRRLPRLARHPDARCVRRRPGRLCPRQPGPAMAPGGPQPDPGRGG